MWLSAASPHARTVDTTDVSIFDTDMAFDSNGGNITLDDVDTQTGCGIIVIAAVDADDGDRDVLSVTLKDTSLQPAVDLTFVQIGRIDSDDVLGDDDNHLLTFWKLDNKAFDLAGTQESQYDEIEITFDQSGTVNETYAFAYVLIDQMGDDLIRNWEEIEISSGLTHEITDLVLEPDALIISAHFWQATGTRTITFSDDDDWNQHHNEGGAGSSGLAIQHDAPNAAANKTMSISTGAIGQEADSIAAAVVIRSDEDILHTPSHTPGTLDTGQTVHYFFEGFTANNKGRSDTDGHWSPASYTMLSRDEMDGKWGSNIEPDRATWVPTHICEGNQQGNHLILTGKTSNLEDWEINIMAFSPLNPDREENWDRHIAGVEEDLNASDDNGEMHEHLSWGSYTGVVIWDFERFCIDYDGAPGAPGSTGWGGPHVYDVSVNSDPEWAYDAACRYYWERLHQWFVEVFATNVEALILYHHPQQPRSRQEGLEVGGTYGQGGPGGGPITWLGVWDERDTDNAPVNGGETWQDDIAWVYKMQGAFDGHCYPMIALGVGDDENEFDVWVTNVMENFESVADTYNVYCYVTLWPGRPSFNGYKSEITMLEEISAIDRMRGPIGGWEDFDVIIYGPVGIGATQGTDTDADPQVMIDYDITDWDAANDEIKIAGHWKWEFDPFDGGSAKWRIDGGTGNVDDLEINFGSGDIPDWPDEEGTPPNDKTVIQFTTDLGAEPSSHGNFQQPNKTITDFLNWWGTEGSEGGGFVRQLELVLGGS